MIPRTSKDQKKKKKTEKRTTKKRKERCFEIFKHVKFCMEKAKGIGSVGGGEAKNGDQGVGRF